MCIILLIQNLLLFDEFHQMRRIRPDLRTTFSRNTSLPHGRQARLSLREPPRLDELATPAATPETGIKARIRSSTLGERVGSTGRQPSHPHRSTFLPGFVPRTPSSNRSPPRTGGWASAGVSWTLLLVLPLLLPLVTVYLRGSTIPRRDHLPHRLANGFQKLLVNGPSLPLNFCHR